MNSGKGNMILLTIIAVVTLLSSVVGTTFIIGFSSNNKEFSSNTADSNVSTIGGQNVAKISTNFTNGNSISGANFNAGDVVATKTFVLQGNVYDAIDLNYNVELFVEENGYSDVDTYVRENEGTYNPDTGYFYCTDCYIKIGMPLGTA